MEIYRKFQAECMQAPSIGIKLHEEGSGNPWDIQADILTSSGIDAGMVRLMPELWEDPRMQGIIKEMARLFPEKEILDS